MRNLILFVQRFYHFFLFLLLLTTAMWTVFSFNAYHQSVFFTAANGINGNFQERVSYVEYYLGLKNENQQLLAENASLRESIAEQNINNWPVVDSQNMLTTFPAKVVGMRKNGTRNYLLVAAGSKQGVHVNMGVISAAGLVGTVVGVSKNFCQVMPIIHEDFRVAPEIAGKSYHAAEVHWKGGNIAFANIENLNKYGELTQGDTVYSVGNSMIFPPKIPIGVITKLQRTEQSDFYQTEIKLATDFRELYHVYLVKNQFLDEINELGINETN